MSLSVPSISQSTPVNTVFKAANTRTTVTKIVSDKKPKAENVLKTLFETAGWLLTIGLLIVGWVTSCTDKKPQQKNSDNITAQMSDNKPSANTVDFYSKN